MAARFDLVAALRPEVSLIIFEYLSPSELLVAGRVNAAWRRLLDTELLWKRNCRHFNWNVGSLPTTVNTDFSSIHPYKALAMRYMKIDRNWTVSNWPFENRKTIEQIGLLYSALEDKVVTCNPDTRTVIDVRSLKTGQVLRSLIGHTDFVTGAEIASDLDHVVTVSFDTSVRVWSLKSGQCLHTMHGHTGQISHLVLHGNIAATGSMDCSVRLWNIETGTPVDALLGHDEWINHLRMSDQHVASVDDRDVMHIWSLATGGLLHSRSFQFDITALSFSTDQQKVIAGTGYGELYIFCVNSGEPLHSINGVQRIVRNVICHGQSLIAQTRPTMQFWDLRHVPESNGFIIKPEKGTQWTSVSCSVVRGLLAATTLDGVFLIDANAGDVVRSFEIVNSKSVIILNSNWLVVQTEHSDDVSNLIVIDFNSPFPNL